MKPYVLRLDEETIRLAQRYGFDPYAVVVRSALGLPVPTGLSPEQLEATLEDVIALTDEILAEQKALEPHLDEQGAGQKTVVCSSACEHGDCLVARMEPYLDDAQLARLSAAVKQGQQLADQGNLDDAIWLVGDAGAS